MRAESSIFLLTNINLDTKQIESFLKLQVVKKAHLTLCMYR